MTPLLHAGSAVLCVIWTLLMVTFGSRRSAWIFAACGLMAAASGLAVALAPETPFSDASGLLQILRSAVWFALLFLWWRGAGKGAEHLAWRFGVAGALATLLALVCLLPDVASALTVRWLGPPGLMARIALALLVVLMAENLFRTAPEAMRWHIILPCVALGGLAAFDVLVDVHIALSQAFSPALIDARAVLSAAAMPLLAIAAGRDRRMQRDPPVSRTMVFHGATLVAAGTFLLGVGAVGEALRHWGGTWAPTAQVALAAGALMMLMVALGTRSVRSRIRRLIVDPFFRARYDYQREWLRCVATLAAADTTNPPDRRAIRATADPVDSPAGMLLVRSREDATLRWAGSWNRPLECPSLPADHALIAALCGGSYVVQPGPAELPDLHIAFADLWLIVPLAHPREGLLGVILLARPRAAFVLDAEVFVLLRTIGREVAMFLAERRAAEALADQAQLQTYAGRFAFVAHDVKTVASQLTLLLANAEAHIADPAFQQDMLLTVRAAADRIGTLIARLRSNALVEEAVSTIDPLDRLRELARRRGSAVEVHDDGQPPCRVAMAAIPFDAAVTHLLDNAADASKAGEPVRIRVTQNDRGVVVDIIDMGMGMSADFVRDALFRPLATSKPHGDGIGAWQARALLRDAGGELAVITRPGKGTTMRLMLPREDTRTQIVATA